VVLTAIALTACSGHANDTMSGAGSASPTTHPTSAASVPAAAPGAAGSKASTASGHTNAGGGASVAAVPIPTSVPNRPADRKAVTLADCSTTPNGATASGLVTRPGNTAADYTITVFFTTSHATVLNYAKTTVRAEPGKPAAWSVTKEFSAPQDLRCVLRGVAVN
jgi:hypothetical protein